MNPSSWLGTLRVSALAALGLACAGSATQGGSPAAVSPAAVSSDVPSLYEAQQQVEEYISSGQYDRDFSAVVARAQEWLEQRSKTAKKPAIVLDIDETSLSNWPAYRLNGWGRVVGGGCDLEHGPCGLRAWQALAKSKALTPTLTLARRAHELGVAVFFISGRPPNLREATERNLREQGYDPTGLILLPEGAHFKSAVDFKAPKRRKITQQGYTIVLSMGDQESDLAGAFAERTFKLPNPVYYLP